MGAAIISDFLTEILIPVAAVVGIVFALVQWVLVSKVKLSPERQGAQPQGGGKNGYGDYVIEEDEGLNDHNVVIKCAEIQNAISEEAERRFGARRRRQRRPRGGVATATGRQGNGKTGRQGEGDGAARRSLGAGLEKPRAVWCAVARGAAPGGDPAAAAFPGGGRPPDPSPPRGAVCRGRSHLPRRQPRRCSAEGYYQGPPVMAPPQYAAPPQRNNTGSLQDATAPGAARRGDVDGGQGDGPALQRRWGGGATERRVDGDGAARQWERSEAMD